MASETNSIRGSTISLSTGLRFSSENQLGSLSQASTDMKKSASSLRSSIKDVKKDPTDSIQGLFLIAEVQFMDSSEYIFCNQLLPLKQIYFDKFLQFKNYTYFLFFNYYLFVRYYIEQSYKLF